MRKDIQIRIGTDMDLPFLSDMLYEAIYIPEGEPRPSREIVNDSNMAKYIQDWGREGDIALIATEHNKAVGAIWVRLFTDDYKTYGYVDSQTPIISMAVSSAYRGLGVGNTLLIELKKLVKEKGYHALSLSVDPNNPALRLYERHGFVKVGVDGTSWDMKVTL
ncbi:GNAT family N-acetyltransferase [Bacillus sp. 31A1R]|uniref:GNAT family N-acetyltransferase n=1 Tax=Robertmurraya mangrovi TaxID=3098077 RepID=A0ABU5IVU6_9BACI|nr:GNAT family N-acetyltransferase [Bacillus sp. 31A1R]MDZ5471250.1 GNAT family N-acetyltransferase [Bacillus sp. 31A1R]